MASDLLLHSDTARAVGLDGTQPRVLRELVEVLTEPLSIIDQQPWQTGEAQQTGVSQCDTIYRKGWKEDPGAVALSAWPGCRERWWSRSP